MNELEKLFKSLTIEQLENQYESYKISLQVKIQFDDREGMLDMFNRITLILNVIKEKEGE